MNRPAYQLDMVLNHALHNASEDAVRAQRTAALSDNMLQSLHERMRLLRVETDKELSFKDRQLAQLTATARERERQIEQLNMSLVRANDRLNSSQEAW